MPIVYIQIEPTVLGGMTPQSHQSSFIAATSDKIKDLGDSITGTIKELSNQVINQIKEISLKPSEVEMEFGISMGADGGFFAITKGTIEANLTVKVTWKME